ncbi:hypothetical protein T069G_04805 [Trichoderma breve]|uniref:Uncharacterized protein n=1 Tax=Trichoderma breve TaxID=2034170 RepID=A0A9W9BC82_9HYPO|nr:hypothetical protein T069G_04805 [Trichoderma breve]KAJ4859817.1 hypothetical protein T069G_04805 [Trichoderma breve]
MPANKNNDANQQQGPRGQKRRNEQEAKTKLANLKTNLKTVVKKIEDVEKEKEHWKKELALRVGNDDDLDAKVEALFEQCGKKDEEVAKKAEENVGEESRTSWW